MNQRNLTRVLAVICIFAAFPLAFLTLPWLPGTVLEFVDLLRAPVWGTESFRVSREALLHHLELALSLYALGLLALGGFAAIAAKVLPRWGELLLWIMAAGTALSISNFWGPSISPKTDPTFIFIAVRIPLVIAAAAVIGAVVTLAGARLCPRAGQCIMRERPRK